MLNRRILRIKAFKVLYSYAENPGMTLKEAESQLELSCKATRRLYLFMLSVIPAVTAEAAARIEAARMKYNPTEAEKHPNMKFVNNAIAANLSSDPDFQKITAREKLSWEQYDVLIRKLYDSMCSKEYFSAYMADPKSTLRQDAGLFTRMFEEEFSDNDELRDILEDLSIYWTDDLEYALSWCCRTMTSLSKGKPWALPELYQSEMLPGEDRESDKAFVTNLLRAAYAGYGEYSQMVASSVTQWDKDRLFVVDVVIIACALAEARSFPEIPVKVTINEYVEITKFYSTPKSRSFVNGLLDRLIQEMIQKGEIVKTGKGLL